MDVLRGFPIVRGDDLDFVSLGHAIVPEALRSCSSIGSTARIVARRLRTRTAWPTSGILRGKWSGGTPILGYEIDLETTKLIVNEPEAIQVRAIFELYLRRQTLRAVMEELHQRGWTNKRWRTCKGVLRGGKPFTKTSLHLLLTNVLYVGKIKHKGTGRVSVRKNFRENI